MIPIRSMTLNDIPFAMRLKTDAGWNQIEQDWQRFLKLRPEGCFVADCEGEPAGTVTTCVFNSVGWIGWVLVQSKFR